MSRYAKSNQTIEDLKSLIKKASDPDFGEDGSPNGILNGDYSATQDRIRKDLSKINVDFENVEYCGDPDYSFDMPGTEDLEAFEMIGSGDSAFPIAWCGAGGDWELPLVFILYIGQKGELRGYIPEDGNGYNHDEKCAYGSEPNSWDDDFEPIDCDDPKYTFDSNKMRIDIMHRIIVKN